MKLFFLSSLIMLCAIAMGQYQPLLYSWNDYHGGYSIIKTEEQGDNFIFYKMETVSKYILNKMGSSDLANALAQHELGNINCLTVYEISKDGKTQLSRQSYWIFPGNGNIHEQNMQSDWYSEAEIEKLFPSVFQSDAPPILTYEFQKFKTYKFDPYYQQFFDEGYESVKCDHPTRTDNDALFKTKMVYDQHSNKFVAAYPAVRIKEDKFASFKSYEVIVSDIECQNRQSYNLKFVYPRVFKEQITVFDINDCHKAVGQLLFFGNMNAGKESNLEKSDLQIAFCAADGKLITSLIKFRPDKKGWERIHGAFSDGENLYISYHTYGRDGAFVGIKKITSNGESVDMVTTEDELKAKRILPVGNIGQLNRSRDVLGGFYTKPDFVWGTPKFNMQGFVKTDSKLYIWGQALYPVSDVSYKGTGLAPTVEYYAEGFVFVYDNSTLNLEKMFALNIPCSKFETNFRLIHKNADEVEFFIPIIAADQKDYSQTIVKKNMENKERFGEEYKHFMNPLFMTINGAEGKFIYYKDLYSVDLTHGLIYSNDGEKYLLGIEAYAGENGGDDGVVGYNNKHYIKIVKVEY